MKPNLTGWEGIESGWAYKFLNADRTGTHATHYKYTLGWQPLIPGRLIACRNGYHILRPDDLIEWLAHVLWRVEFRGDYILNKDKVVARQIRLHSIVDTWNERTARLFAADCAEHVLHIYTRQCPNNTHIAECIHAVREYADNKITREQLAAAWAAAWAAAGAAARAAAWAAARDAAWAAARDAAWGAARDAAWAAARDAATKWQTERLHYYLRGENED